ncbi:MAG: glycosyltransferase family 39 protein [Candidatus Sumerlaeia bacterium]|nr:glycosyltransferase family 39 protein [Candidatus Sumerlaeia bacterium]
MRNPPKHHLPIATNPVAGWELLTLGFIILVGLAARLLLLPHVPGLWYDEAINGLDALKILRDPGLPIFFDTNNHMREPMFMYLELIGVLLGGTSAMALRSVSLVIGVVTIPVVWWLVREWKGAPEALLAAAILATLRWHVIFSCLAFRTILAPLFMALAAIFFLRLLRRGTWLDAILWGAALGAGAYTYLAFRLVPLIFLPPMIMEIVRRWRQTPDAGKALLARYGAMVATAFLIFLPLGINYLLNPQHFTGRGDEVSLFQRDDRLSMITAQARDVALMPMLRGDHEGKHNVPGPPSFLQLTVTPPEVTTEMWDLERQFASMEGRPQMDPHGTGAPVFGLAMGLVFYVGFVLLLVTSLKNTLSMLVVSWLIVGSLASILSFGAPNMLRLLILVPAVIMVLVAGFVALGGVAGTLFHKWFTTSRSRQVATVGLLVFVGGSHLIREARLLVHWPQHSMVTSRFNLEMADLGDFLRQQDDRLPVLLPGPLHPPAPTLAFLADGYEFTTTPPPDTGEWWELRTHRPFPPLQAIGEPVFPERSLRINHPAGIPFADLVLVRKRSLPINEEDD